ncbi:hypothetical protein BpHYR1_026132 [Brachionus plicatilis]|uniref:Uncharacterized protein n=1 Tax=Brachionus plicatilis TaxID=10195 RepID=A0A3M7T742_BRAPC|nr:hypothetical protein BpHYR1_026132 [Brachionus plicatilis]
MHRLVLLSSGKIAPDILFRWASVELRIIYVLEEILDIASQNYQIFTNKRNKLENSNLTQIKFCSVRVYSIDRIKLLSYRLARRRDKSPRKLIRHVGLKLSAHIIDKHDLN